MTKMIESLTIDPNIDNANYLTVDGEPFPFHVLADSASIVPASMDSSIAMVTLTLMVDGPIHLWPKLPAPRQPKVVVWNKP